MDIGLSLIETMTVAFGSIVVCPHGEVARPTLRIRGLLGQAEPILTAGAMGDDTEIFVGIDVAKVRNAIAIADGERGGEVRFLGGVVSSEESMRRVVKRIAAKHRCVQLFNFAMKPVQPATGCID